MSTWYVTFDEPYAIEHHGIKGQKWGIRRFQNPDGSLTEEGMRRYNNYKQSEIARAQKNYDKAQAKADKNASAKNVKNANDAKKVLDMVKNMTVEDAIAEQDAASINRAARLTSIMMPGIGAAVSLNNYGTDGFRTRRSAIDQHRKNVMTRGRITPDMYRALVESNKR